MRPMPDVLRLFIPYPPSWFRPGSARAPRAAPRAGRAAPRVRAPSRAARGQPAGRASFAPSRRRASWDVAWSESIRFGVPDLPPRGDPHGDEALDPLGAVTDLAGGEAHDEGQVRVAAEPVAGGAELRGGLLDHEELVGRRAIGPCGLSQARSEGGLEGTQACLLGGELGEE